MTLLRKFTYVPVVALTALAALALPTDLSATQEKGQNTSEKTQKEIREALVSVKDYSIAKRDEFMKTAKSAINVLDQRIEQLEDKLDDQSDEATEAVRQKWKETLVNLRPRRIAITKMYDELKQSSENAWDKLKEGFLSAYDEVANAVDEVDEVH
jgi:CII-binding regulator of phage lambda lysogenization HflD